MEDIKEVVKDIVAQAQAHYEYKDREHVDALIECIKALQWVNEHESNMYKLTIRLLKLKESDGE